MSRTTETSLRPLVSLASQTFIYGFGPLSKRLVVYFTIPILTSHMGMDSYGAVAVLISILSLFGTVSNAGIPSATFRLYNENDDADDQSKTLGSSLILLVLFAVLVGLFIWIAADAIATNLLGDPVYAGAIRILALVLVVITLIFFADIVLRIQVRPKSKVLLDVTLVGTQTVFALGLVVLFNLGVAGYMAGQLAGAIIGFILALLLIKGTISLSYSGERIKELLHFGLPLLPATLGLWGLRLADRSLITASLGLSEVAVYEVGYKVGMITAIFTAPFLLAWPQFAFSRMHRADAAHSYRNVLTATTATTMFLAVIVISFRHELVSFMAPADYAAAAVIVPWIALAQVAWTIYPIISIGPKIAKNTALLALITLAACLVNLGLNVLLIPRIGIVGAAAATFVGYWALAIFAYVFGNRYFSVALDWRRLIQILIAVGLALLITTQIVELLDAPWQRTLLQIGGVAIYPLVLLLIGFVTRDQIRQSVHYGLLRARAAVGRS